MKSPNVPVAVVVCLISAVAAQAQEGTKQNAGAAATASDARQAQSETIIPRLVKFSGTLLDEHGQAMKGPVGVTFALYAQQSGGAALWLETQNVRPDVNGAYTVLLGAASANGVPAELFVSGEARWLGIQVGQQPEHERILLVSVPYALKAGDAETLGGKPLSSFVLNEASATGSSAGPATFATSSAAGRTQTTTGASAKTSATPQAATPCSSVTSDGTAIVNSIALFTTPCNVQSSLMTQASINGFPGVNVAGNNAGLLLNGTGTHQITVTGASSGRLGQDATGFFFSSDTNGKVIKFLTNNGTLNEWMRITSAGNVGIGTTTPAAKLDVAGGLNAITGTFNSGANTLTSFTGGTTGTGLSGVASASTAGSAGTGVLGQTNSTNGIGVWGQANDTTGLDATGSPAESDGVHGDSAGPYGVGVSGNAFCGPNSGCPADNSAASTSKGGTGVSGFSASPWGGGMSAVSTWPPNNCGTPANPTCDPQSGGPVGIFAQAKSVQGVAVLGNATSILAANNTATTPPGPPIARGGPVGTIGRSRSPNGVGVFGAAVWPPVGCGTPTLPNCNPNIPAIGVAGVYGVVRRTAGAGVYGESDTLLGTAATFDNAAGKLNSPPTTDCLNAGTPAGSGCNVLIAQANDKNVFRVSGDGHVHAAAYDIGGADFAESVAIRGARTKYEPGDVLVIDTRGNRRLAKAREPYSPLVAGVVSTKPGVLASLHSTADSAGEAAIQNEVPLAVIGIVPCKVTAENGPISPGDLLVTSSAPGYAMKGTDRQRMLGAVVGKALEPLQQRRGIIQVLVTLQ